MARRRTAEELVACATRFEVNDTQIDLADGDGGGWVISRDGGTFMLSDTGEWVVWSVAHPSNPADRKRIIWEDLDAAFVATENNDSSNMVSTVEDVERWRDGETR